MDEFWGTLATLCRPRDHRSIVEWSREFVKPPNSARSASGFDPALTPWLVEPINAHADASIREIVCMMPTGAGKTQILDCTIPYEICEAPGSILLGIQGNNQAKLHVQSRLMPTLRKIPQVSHIMEGMDRHKIKSDAVIFPHLTLYMGGINLTNGQSKSVDRVKLDEVWEATPHGIIEEFRARTHDRPLSLCTLVSQGGFETVPGENGPVPSEWAAAWNRTDQRVYHWKCPECGGVQRFRFRGADSRGFGLRYNRGDKEDEIDELAVKQSARLACLDRCGMEFADTPQNRFLLSSSGRYIATNPGADPIYRGYQCNVLALHYVPWATTALRHAQAHLARKKGDPTPLRIFRQKRMAENYREEEALPAAVMPLGEYAIADYADGQEWQGEALRIMGVDVQRAHFWTVIRAFRADGASRLLWCGKVGTWETLREIQLKFRVRDPWVMVDAQYEQDDVLNRCAQYNTADIKKFPSSQAWARSGWTSMQGDKGNRWKHTPRNGLPTYRFFSPFSFPRGTSGLPASHIFWSSLQVKRILEKFRGGYRQPFEIPHDVPNFTAGLKESESYLSQMFGDVEFHGVSKTTGRPTTFYKKVREHDHFFDCEAMILVGAMIANILHFAAEEPDEHEQKPPPVVN